jgi:hypothetical protein
MKQFLRILMNAADGSPGGGAPPAPGAPAPAPAQGQPQGLTRDDLKSFADDVRNGVFADLRRAGVLGKEPKSKRGDEEPVAGTPPAPPAADPMKLRELDRALGRLGAADKLSDAAYKRMERAFVEEAPTDTAAWAKDYLGGYGFAQPAPGSAAGGQQASTVSDPNKPPVSNAGGVPNPNVPIEERSLIGMSESDINHLVKTKGPQWVRKRLYEQLRGVRVKVSAQ